MRPKSHQIAGILITLALLALGGEGWSQQIYFEDFESGVGPEWSSTSTEVTPVGNRRFLGQYAENDAVTVSLAGLPVHSEVTVSFDLFIIASWDGNNGVIGPDRWRMGEVGGPVQLDTTFSNHTGTGWWDQSYPENYHASYPAGTGAAEISTLGYPLVGDADFGDCVYHIEVTIPHASDSIGIVFSSDLQGNVDESWGLDNVSVSVGPVTPVEGWEVYR